jgi:methyltransferase (TIGR00027 family)
MDAMPPVSLTAFYTCAVRARDAARPAPVVGDVHAQGFMDDRGHALWARMRDLRLPALSIVARHRLIDDRLRALLAADPGLRIVLLGAGFDSRAFRLRGGRWLEIDEPAVIAHKEARLPAANAPSPLQRIAIDFATESLAERLAPFREDARVVVVMEGVLLYLDAAQQAATAAALAGLAPQVRVLADVMSQTFFRRAGHATHDRLRELGAPFKVQSVDVPALWSRAGFVVAARHSIPAAMSRFGLVRIPGFALATVLRWLREGYGVLELARPGRA